MQNLRQRLAEHGFESNEDYSFALRCLQRAPIKGLRTLNIEGTSVRRQTALANALGHALEYPQILYYDFTQQGSVGLAVEVPNIPDEEGQPAQPLTEFDRAVSEACAFSEAEPTMLIIDQLQAADFREHIRLYHFAAECEWTYPLATLRANPKNLLLVLISEQPLYHSLQNASFRIWADAQPGSVSYQPHDFSWPKESQPVFEALNNLFEILQTAPTRSEMELVLNDLELHVRSVNQFRDSLYGWTESIHRDQLLQANVTAQIQQVLKTLEDWVGVDEIELSGE